MQKIKEQTCFTVKAALMAALFCVLIALAPAPVSYTHLNINTMLEQMLLLLILGFVLIYLIMVAQFQSLLSPFIIILTVPLAFTGGFFALWFSGEGLTMLSLMGFAVLMGTVVNNGIVFVDYVNQLRRGGLEKHHALVAAGKTRMRPILMTALTTILALSLIHI